LRQRIAVAIDAPVAISQFDFGARGEPLKRLLRLRHIVASPAERRRRRLGADQPHDRAIGQRERLAVDDLRHRAPLRLRQHAGRGRDRRTDTRKRHSKRQRQNEPNPIRADSHRTLPFVAATLPRPAKGCMGRLGAWLERRRRGP
jgi:hypothetical protein